MQFRGVEFKQASPCWKPGLNGKLLKTAVIGSTMVPTLIAGIAFLPKHLLTRPVGAESTERVCIQVRGNGLSEEG